MKLAASARYDITASLAGITRDAAAGYIVPVICGGFGGWRGLADHLEQTGTDSVIDATHPFASRISLNAAMACRKTGTPIARLIRPEWQEGERDNWIPCADLMSALVSLPAGSIVLAPLGGRRMLDDCHLGLIRARSSTFLLRVIENSAKTVPEGVTLLVGKPPFTLDHELGLIDDHAVTCLICRNSGGNASRAKLEAAAIRKLPVYMITRPQEDALMRAVPAFSSLEGICEWVECLPEHAGRG